MSSCLDSPDGSSRSFGSRLLKLFFLLLFIISSSQLFALLYHFIRLLSYVILDPHTFPPKPLPARTSLFGFDLLKFDTNANDNATLLYVFQAVFASVCSIIFGTLGTTGICRESRRLLRVTSAILGIVLFITGFGAASFPGMTPIMQVLFPFIGGGTAIGTLLGFSLLFPPKVPNYRPDYI